MDHYQDAVACIVRHLGPDAAVHYQTSTDSAQRFTVTLDQGSPTALTFSVDLGRDSMQVSLPADRIDTDTMESLCRDLEYELEQVLRRNIQVRVNAALPAWELEILT